MQVLDKSAEETTEHHIYTIVKHLSTLEEIT